MWKKILAALGVVITLIVIAVSGVFGRMFGETVFNFFTSESQISEPQVLPSEMPLQHAGQLSIKYAFPFSLNEAESKKMVTTQPITLHRAKSGSSPLNSSAMA